MKTAFFLVVGIVSFLFSDSIYAQTSNESLKIDLEIRPRFEFRNGFKRPISKTADPASFIEQRSRLYFDFKQDEISVHLTLQDVRMWGNTSTIYKADPSLHTVYEAWASYKLNPSSLIKVGRQALDYDNARFLGNLDWAQQGRSHDAFLYQFQSKESQFRVDAGFTWNQIGTEPSFLTENYYSVANNKTMQFVWLNKKIEQSEFSFLLHNNGVTSAADSATYFMPTVGLIGNHTKNAFSYHAELYYQFGKDGLQNEVNAYLINAEVRYKPKKITFTLGFDWLSGTEKSATGKNNSFTPLYGTNHKFYGYMDYFYVGNAHKQAGALYDAGLINLYEKFSFPLAKGTLNVDFHQFLSPTTIYNATPEKLSAYLGTEIDLVYVLKPAKNVSLFLGYSHMFQTKTMDRIKGATNIASIQNWAWVMLQIKPTIFQKS